MVFGVVGYVYQGWSWSDAFYMVVITISGVGYGEDRPLVSPGERVHTMMVIGFGLIAVAYTLAGFVHYLTEGEIRTYLGQQRMRREIAALTGHTIIVGFGRVGSLVAEELLANQVPFVVVEKSADRFAEIERRGYPYVGGDATEEETLRSAGTVDNLLNPENKAKLAALLTYHVTPSKAMIADVEKFEGRTVKSVEGSPIKVEVEGEAVMVNNAKVVKTDIACSNGAIHVIDTVIVPPKK